ncbi:MAG: hypothetical protein JKY51_11815 [Opitutaceae bacterium]|nr:hypothetical protein [Opitutaceae bacterium]
MSKSDSELSFNRLIETISIFVALGIMVVIGFYTLQFQNNPLGGTAAFGAFGDYIGGLVNPILGFSTVMLLIYSIRLQMKELRESTEALQASQEAHEDQVKVSTGLLNEAKKANADQLKKMQGDVIRSQLTKHAEMLTNEHIKLMGKGFLPQSGDNLSLDQILMMKRRNLNKIAQTYIDGFPSQMDTQNEKLLVVKIHLLTVKEKVHLTTLTLIDLLPMLELPSLKALWEDRIHDMLADYEDLRIFTNEEVFTYAQKLSAED